jgi:hypothetical protein
MWKWYETLIRAQKAVEELESRNRQITQLEADFRWITRIYTINTVFREMIEQVLTSGAGTEEEQRKRLGTMLDVLVSDKTVLFGMGDDRWNFAIYLYDKATNQLNCVACRRPVRAEEDAEHRSWTPGDGHVGLAFQTRRPIVASDTSDPEASPLFDASPTMRRDDDRERYRSIASIPIRLEDEMPVGVVVATSDLPDRFSLRRNDHTSARDAVEPLRSLASALAMLIQTSHVRGKDSK